jgi:hypothetical protein
VVTLGPSFLYNGQLIKESYKPVARKSGTLNTTNLMTRYLYNVYYLEDLTKEPIGIVFYQKKFHQFFHSEMSRRPYLGLAQDEVNKYKLPDDDTTIEGSTEDPSLYRSITQWSSLINNNQEALKEPESPGHQASMPTITPATYSTQ